MAASAPVQISTNTTVAGTGTSRVFAVTTATAAGDTLLVVVTGNTTAANASISALTDSKGNKYTLDASLATASPAAVFFRSPGATGGSAGGQTAALTTSDTFTVTTAAFSFTCGLYGVKVTGAGPLDTSAGGFGATVASVAASVTTTQANDDLIALGSAQATAVTLGYSAPFTAGTQVTTQGLNQPGYDLAAGAAGSYTATMTMATAASGRVYCWAFLPTSSSVALADRGAAADTFNAVPYLQVSPPIHVRGAGPVALTLPKATGTGNTLVVCASSNGSTGNPTVSGITLGGSADNFAPAVQLNSATRNDAEIWYDPNAAAGQTAVSVSFAGGSGTLDLYAEVYEIPGILAVDQIVTGEGNGTAWSSGSTPTTTVAAEFFVGNMINTGSTIPTVTAAGWEPPQQISANTYVQTSSVQQVTATGTATYSGTLSTARNFTAAVATFYVGKAVTLADQAAAADSLNAGPTPYVVATGLTTGAVTARTASVTGPTQAGDTLLALVTTQATACTISALTDARGNVYTLDASVATPVPLCYWFRSPGATGGPGGSPTVALQSGDLVTATSAAQTGNVEILLIGVPGVAAVDIITAVATGTNGTPARSFTPGHDRELAIAMLADSNTGGAPTITAPFSLLSTYHTGVNPYNTAAWRQLPAGTAGIGQSFGATITAIQWDALVWTFPLAAPKMTSLADTFPGTAVGPLWTSFGSVAVSGNVASLTDTATTANPGVLQSTGSYDLTASQLAAQLVSAGTQQANTMAILKVQADANNSAQMLVQNGTLACQHQVAGSFSAFLASVSYSAAVHQWLRMREAGGTLYYEWSTDGISWTTLYSEADPITLTALTATLQEYNGATDPVATSQWANVNTLPSATPVTAADAAGAVDALTVSATVVLADAAGAADAPAASATVSLPDVAAAAEASAVAAAVPLAETGAAADTVATPQRTLPLADTAGAADAATAAVAVPLADRAAAAEAATAAVTLPLADVGAAADAVSVAAASAPALPDAAGAADALTVAVTAPLAEQAAAADVLAATVGQAPALAEAAGAADALVVQVTVPLADVGAASYASVAGPYNFTQTVQVPLADQAAAADQQAAQAAVPLTEQAGAADALAIPAKTLPVPDAGGAADALTAAVTSPAADVAAATDALTVQQGIFVGAADAAGAADSLTVAVAVPVADTAAAVESSAVGMPVALADAGAAVDATVAAAAVQVADIAGAADAETVAAAVPLAEQAGAADAVGTVVGAAPALNDVAAGADQVAVAGSAPLAEAAGAADSLSVIAGLLATQADVAAATEAATVAGLVPIPDAAAAADSLATTAAVPVQDVAGAADSITVVVGAAPALPDAAGATDALSVSVQVALPDAAGAADGLTAAVAAQPVLADAGAATDALRAAVAAPSHDVAAASDALVVVPAQDRVVSDSAGAVDSLLVTIPPTGPQPVWLCGAAAQRWSCAIASLRWAVAAAGARWETEPSQPRWAVRMLDARWVIILADFDPVAAISAENVNVVWTSDLGGDEVDPTAGPMPVQFAFPVSSGNDLRPAEPVSWLPGAWLDPAGRQKGWIAQVLIGPTADGGLVQLVAGTDYDVWSEVDTGSEKVRKYAGTLSVY